MTRPRTDQVNGCFIVMSIIGTTKLFSINRNHFALRYFNGTTNPVDETLFEFGGVYRTKHTPEGIMRWNAFW